ncbi:MAG: tetratricopeptide repeat protein [Acidobacteriota bacterium]|nr:tetratricopeptide repeat protein [Acidobacteriota bacterium]
MENLKIFFQIYFRPAQAMSELLDKGSWIFAAAAVLLVSAAFFLTVNAKLAAAYRVPNFYEFYQPTEMDEDSPAAETEYQQAFNAYEAAVKSRQMIPLAGDYFYKFFTFEPLRFYQPLLNLSIFYIPAFILLICVFGGIGSFGTVFKRDYGALAVCTLSAWAAAHLPFAVAGIALYSQNVAPEIYFAMWMAGSLLFGVLMIFAARTVFGVNYAAAFVAVSGARLGLSAGMYVLRFISPWLFSPFLLIYGYLYFGGAVSGGAQGIGDAFRQKQNFKRFLHNATVNPKDADAHVQLGLIYLKRRQETKALEHFRQAAAIDKTEIDANYELGKIARSKGEYQTALDHFAIVIEQNDKYALSEIWREIGATYLDAQMFAEARSALEKFVERRATDAEGLYYLGKIYQGQNEPEKAREIFQQVIESARISPDFRRRQIRYWSKLAQKEI